MSRQDDIRKLIINHNRRLQIREEQLALQSKLSADPEVIIEIEDIKAKIEELQAELKDLASRGRIKLTEKSTNPNSLIFETNENHITIGRSPKNSVTISNQKVSWEHGQITLRKGIYFYRHLSENNPSILRRKNEEYLLRVGEFEEKQLATQDCLIIGDTTLIVEFDAIKEDPEHTPTEKQQDESLP